MSSPSGNSNSQRPCDRPVLHKRSHCPAVRTCDASNFLLRTVWLWLSSKLQQNGFMLRSTIPWPGQTREFLQLSRMQQRLHLVALVREKLDTVVWLPVSVPNVEGRSQVRKLASNEWEALTAVISAEIGGPKPVGFGLQIW